MPGISTTADIPSRGGLGVVLFVFFILSFALTIGAEVLLARLASGKSDTPVRTEQEVIAKDLVKPSPAFAPEKVVALQLEGLANSKSPSGIEQCFAFASPSNKQMTGPLVRFSAMLHQAPYDALLDHHLKLVGKPVVNDESAIVIVTVLDNRDEIHVFQFLLSKQHGENVEGCWMTDAVFPLQRTPNERPVVVPTALHPIRTLRRTSQSFPGRPILWVFCSPLKGNHG